jgi:hypothetical protein
MSIRGTRLVNNKEPLLRQLVFEARYNYGYNYLDRCGKILNRIAREHGEWVPSSQVSPQNAPLYSMKNECKFVFGPVAVNFSINRTNSDTIILDEEVHDFAIQCEEMTAVVVDELELKDFSRIGFRAWYYFPFDSKIESDAWLRDLGIFSFSPELISAYGDDFESMSAAVIITGKERRLRIGFESIESAAQFQSGPETINVKTNMLRGASKDFLIQQRKERRRLEINTRYAAVVDFDSFQEDPYSIDPRDFITRNFSVFMDPLYGVVSSIKTNSGRKG